MTIRKVKGEWQAGYKDTYRLDYSLSPIIYAALKKFHDVLEKRNKEGECMGIPQGYMKNEEEWVTDSDVKDWLDDVQKMMYAFNPDSEPDIRDYDFSYPNMFTGDGKCDFTCSNEAERERYHEDRKKHQVKVEEGLKLFAEKYQDLWW